MNSNDTSRSSRAIVVVLAVLLASAALVALYSVVLAAAWAGALKGVIVVGATVLVAAVAVWAWRSRAGR